MDRLSTVDLLASFSSSYNNDEGCGRFYEPACQVSSVVVAASGRPGQTSSDGARPLNQPERCARKRVSIPARSPSASSPRGRYQRRDSSFYSRSSVALLVPAHSKVRRRSSALCGTALNSGQTPTRACSSSLTTSPVTRRLMPPRRRGAPAWWRQSGGHASADTRSGRATSQTECGRAAERAPPWPPSSRDDA